MDLDEPVNVDMEPEDALRILLDVDCEPDDEPHEADEEVTDESE